jgi:hypothetical protein
LIGKRDSNKVADVEDGDESCAVLLQGGRRRRCSALAQRMTAADWHRSMKNGAARAGAEGVPWPALVLDIGYR